MSNQFKKRWTKSVAAVAVASVLGFTTAVFAADAGGLKVQVLDASGKPLAGAKVHAETPESLTKKDAITDAEGFAYLNGLDPSTKYNVRVEGDGFAPVSREDVLVVSGKSFNLVYSLSPSADSNADTIEVVGRMQAIDTTSAVVSTDITLDLTESLPTGRNYQSYLQLVPGVKPSLSGNPSSKSGVNYADTGTVGTSSDNIYYIDGINVTDGVSGTFGANINSEIIQEMQVFTGAVPAEFEGGSGLVSKVVTKSGSNEFTGSINYYRQDDSLVAANKHLEDSSFMTYDTAFTFGGPIVADKVWFFTSFQKKYRQDDVVNADSGDFMRTVDDTSNFGFLKLTAQLTDNDRFVMSYFNDPRDISGSTSSSTPNNRDLVREQGGDNYRLEYTHSWDDLTLSVETSQHKSELTRNAKLSSARNEVAYLTGDPSLEDINRGGFGTNFEEHRDSDTFKIALEYYLDSSFGSHTIKAGYTNSTFENAQNETTPSDARWTSISNGDSGATMDDYLNGTWQGSVSLSAEDFPRIHDAMLDGTDSAYYLGLLDSDNDGDLSDAELNAIVFNSTTGNPDGQVNAYRIVQVQAGPVTMKIEGQSIFVQDSWNYGDLTVNAGIRGEKWEHIASTGETAFTFDWDWAPRVSAAYDLFGDGSSKITGFFGRYYDPIRGNMTDFAGNLSGPVLDEQVFVGDRWLTFRTRGGASTPDALFAPATKTPYTDELLLGYSQALTDTVTFDATYTKRETRDILEDFDLKLYTETLAGTDYELPLSYFGYDSMPDSNYVIATLKGGERNYEGVEFTLRKRKSDNWQALASYTYNDAEGNTNSDSNADFQGDVVWLDPRSPNQYGPQPGNIKHQLKFAGSYFWDNGFEVGAVYNWNSGVLYSRTWSIYGRHLPMRVGTGYNDGGFTSRWIEAGSVGSQESSAYGTLDLRVKYSMNFAKDYTAEFFLDIFNALDDQAATSEQDLVAGDGVYAFGEDNSWVAPRRFYLGARVSF